MSDRPNPQDQDWPECEYRLGQELRKWGVESYELSCSGGENFYDYVEESQDRIVTVKMTGGPYNGTSLYVYRHPRPVDNLWALRKGVESIRQNERRGLSDVARQIYQWEPAAQLQAENKRLRGIAELAESAYRESTRSLIGAYPESDVEVARYFGDTFGYGAMMTLLSAIWREKDPVGAFTVGHCYGSLEVAIAGGAS